MTTAPCKDCPDRQVGCKSTCPAWAEWEKEKARRVEEKKKNTGPRGFQDGIHRETGGQDEEKQIRQAEKEKVMSATIALRAVIDVSLLVIGAVIGYVVCCLENR